LQNIQELGGEYWAIVIEEGASFDRTFVHLNPKFQKIQDEEAHLFWV
jgi:hypothetical protein